MYSIQPEGQPKARGQKMWQTQKKLRSSQNRSANRPFSSLQSSGMIKGCFLTPSRPRTKNKKTKWETLGRIQYPINHCKGTQITKAENSKFWFDHFNKIVNLCSSTVHFSLEIQMPKRPLVVKTYGRHKYRTVKAQSWLSPDETFLSPFGDQSRLSSKFEFNTSDTNLKPKTARW